MDTFTNFSSTNSLRLQFATIAKFFREREKIRKPHFTNLTLTKELGVRAPSFSLFNVGFAEEIFSFTI